jgi:hypothetical protein
MWIKTTALRHAPLPINIGMRLIEIAQGFDPLLLEFWETAGDKRLSIYATRGGCGGAASDFLEFLESRGIVTAEVIPAGHMRGGKKAKGWFRTDVPDLDLDAFTKEELAAMKQHGFNPRKETDRAKYARSENMEDQLRWIPHAWVENRGKILDPSGFYPNGQGQFDGLIKDRSNLEDRYQYFR